jgi:hypothetical protein
MIDIVQKVIEYKASKIKMWPVNANRAGELGHPCDRYLVYLRTRGMERPLHDVGLQFIFDDGNVHEASVLRDLQGAGIKIIEQQRAFEWKKYQITGRIDGKIQDNGNIIPIEIKSFNEWNWKAINSAEDMFKSKAIYMKKYPAQLTLYLIMDEKEEGLFILKNKVNGLLKQIPLKLDFAYAESLIQKAERINAHVQAGTLPDRILYNDNISGFCPFSHICLPDVTHEATLLDDPELEIKLNRRWELKEAKDEFENLDKEIKESVKEKPSIVIGKWAISGKWIDKKELTVKASRYWQTSIKTL